MSKTIYITENQLKTILNESTKDKVALKFLESKGVTDYNEQMKYIGSLKHDIPNLRLDNGYFMLGALRLYFDRQLSDEQSIRTLDRVLKYIHGGNHTKEFDFDFNGLSLQELDNKFADAIKQDSENDRKRSEQVSRGNGNGYKIIPINSYEEAKPYGEYTSWCVTHGEDAFDTYTAGGNRFYFCLKNGFENIERNDEGAPINEWGLSMIAVNVDPNGNLTRITTRYNHDFDGENNPKLNSVEQLEDVLDVNFYQVFKPYTREELHKIGIVLLDEVQGLLDSGKKPEEVFNWVDSFSEGFAVVKLNDKYNLIDTNGKLLSNQWFDYVEFFNEGFAVIELNDKRNFIDKEGKLLSSQWFDYCNAFNNGYARVELNYKRNFIDKEGKLLSNQWFDYCYDFSDGFALVQLKHKSNFINKEGKLISSQWFDHVNNFNNGYAQVILNGNLYKIDTEGNLYDINKNLIKKNELNENNMLMESKTQEETTYYRFLSEVKAFLAKLLKKPISAQPSQYLKDRDFDKNKLIRVLIKRDILERNENILTPDKTGEKDVKYCVTYKVKRKDFERKIRKIHIQYFEKNVPEKEELDEEEVKSVFADELGIKKAILKNPIDKKAYIERGGMKIDECDGCGDCGAFIGDMGGATSTSSVGSETSRGDVGYDVKLGGVINKPILQKRKKDKNYTDPTNILGKTINETKNKNIFLTEEQLEYIKKNLKK